MRPRSGASRRRLGGRRGDEARAAARCWARRTARVGIFTERDLLNRVDHRDSLWSHVVVRDVMTPLPMVIRRDDSLAEAMRRLTQGHRRHLPVVDAKGSVLGLIAIRDILSYIAGRFPEEMMNLPPDPSHSLTAVTSSADDSAVDRGRGAPAVPADDRFIGQLTQGPLPARPEISARCPRTGPACGLPVAEEHK